MRKQVALVAAISAALFASGVSAQASVTLYGRVDLNLTKFSGEPLEQTAQSNSRWGLRGSESLGGGLSAIFQLESRINADTGTGESGRLFGRESWMGLRGGFGTLRLGRSLSPSQRVASNYDPHGTDGIGSFGSTSLILGHTNLVRLENAAYYETPSMGGFSVFGSYQLDEVKDATDAKIWSVRLRYAQGPVDVALAHGKLGGDNDVTSFGASFDFKSIKPMIQYHRGERGGADRKSWLVGATAPVGAHGVRFAVSRLDFKGSSPVKRDLIALGYDHNLSKRTVLYGTIVRDKENSDSATGVELGIRHLF
jgi:predicted porin